MKNTNDMKVPAKNKVFVHQLSKLWIVKYNKLSQLSFSKILQDKCRLYRKLKMNKRLQKMNTEAMILMTQKLKTPCHLKKLKSKEPNRKKKKLKLSTEKCLHYLLTKSRVWI